MFGRTVSWAVKREGDAPGWIALETALAAKGLAEPMHFPTGNRPGERGAYALNAYRRADAWVLMTWGLSDLFGDAGHRRDGAGWGVEYTTRVPAADYHDVPPEWARLLLLALAETSVKRGSPFAAGELLDTAGPISGRRKSAVTALAFAADPELANAWTPHGAVSFVTAYGITAIEQGKALVLGVDAFLADARTANPLLVTDEKR